MDDIFEELYYQFVYLPKKDACPERTARWEPFFHDAPLDLVDAKDGLVYNAALTVADLQEEGGPVPDGAPDETLPESP